MNQFQEYFVREFVEEYRVGHMSRPASTLSMSPDDPAVITQWISNIQAAVLGVYSSDPNDFATNNRDGLESALTSAGIAHQFNVYPDTHHDFYNDTGQAYNDQQALVAWGDAVSWMQAHL